MIEPNARVENFFILTFIDWSGNPIGLQVVAAIEAGG
jgi:hypothetical protein